MRPTKAIINLSCLKSNIENIVSLLPAGTDFMAVIKANAYGHGMFNIAEHAVNFGAKWLGVALPEEGAALRDNGIKVPILVLGEVDEEQTETVLNYDLTQTVPSLSTALKLNKAAENAGKKINIHLKLDTGMGRIGIRSIRSLEDFLKNLEKLSFLNLDGVFTHFASADEDDLSFTQKQMIMFNEMVNTIKSYCFNPLHIHASNSAGILNFPEAHYNLVRSGIAMYGYYPSAYTEQYAKVKLLPVLQWETRVVHIKHIEAGDTVSYGRTFTADKKLKVATLPVGYADGYNRLLSNKADVLIHGKRARIIGRVCMDQVMVDITDIPDVALEDPAVLIGEQGQECVTADELAELCGTISYEILTSISDRVPRIYIEV